ncbi:MAG: Na/Pi symporter [Rhodospirillaceae bacterium]
MNTDILLAIGGVGLFLLGMLILTDGLKDLAGNALRRALARFTTNPVSGAAAGAVTTAVIQSSSATTVTAIGFVGAGLMTFSQALGVIFGANIGTTMTGWLVALIGFKLHLGVVVLPLVLLGVLLKMFGRGRIQSAGWALAGFSLLFIGIDAMQQGMAVFEGHVTPSDFPGDGLIDRLQLVGIGIAITLVTQSSSAGIATAMVALSTGTISFPQAAAMVIGMDVGTTFTAFLATIGGSTAMRQTGYAHVVYNIMTGIIAFILLGFYTAAVQDNLTAGTGDVQVALVAFHSLFNIIGVLLVLPFTTAFATLITRLVPERGPHLTTRLDDQLLPDASAAVDAAAATAQAIALDLFHILADLLDPHLRDDAEEERLAATRRALDETRYYLNRIKTEPSQSLVHLRHVATIHAIDHLNRLYVRCKNSDPLKVRRYDHRLKRLAGLLERVAKSVSNETLNEQTEVSLDRVRSLLRTQRRSYRHTLITRASRGEIEPDQVADRLDSIRWLHRSAYHVWRAVHHLRQAVDTSLSPDVENDLAPLATSASPQVS